MAITENELVDFIDAVGGQILEKKEKTIIFSKYNPVFSNKNAYFIALQENGEMFQIYNSIGSSSELLGTNDTSTLNKLLLNNNANTKFGTWEVDDSGDIMFAVEIPLEDNTLTEKQFKRIINLMESSTVTLIKILKDSKNSNNGI